MTQYIAIVGDVINSKDIKDRFAVQDRLATGLADINKDFGKDIAANFVLTLGDEFQGLLHGDGNFLDIIETVKWRMYPVRIRFAIGKGEIATTINPLQAIGADGPAFHRARAMMEQLRKEESTIYTMKPTMLYSSCSKDDILINELLRFCSYLEDGWTERQREIIRLARIEGKKQADIARQLGIEQSTVSRALRSSGYLLYNSGLRSLNEYLVV